MSNNSPLALKEILWEITPRCNKNCRFCGSAHLLNKLQISDEKLIEYARDIASDQSIAIGLEKVTITGGEPGTVDISTMEKIINVITNAGIRVSVVTNGLFIKNIIENSSNKNFIDAVGRLSCIGLSFNDESDKSIELIKQLPIIGVNIPITVITNFGIHNVFEFDNIREIILNQNFARKTNYALEWQIQLTMGPYQLQSAGIKYLREQIKLNSNNIRIHLADNLQHEHVCSAGINSCSITFDGFVISCLSKRSWISDVLITYEGYLDESKLSDIWDNGFYIERFDSSICTCCRDCIKYPQCNDKKSTDVVDELLTIINNNDGEHEVRVHMYGVVNSNEPITRYICINTTES